MGKNKRIEGFLNLCSERKAHLSFSFLTSRVKSLTRWSEKKSINKSALPPQHCWGASELGPLSPQQALLTQWLLSPGIYLYDTLTYAQQPQRKWLFVIHREKSGYSNIVTRDSKSKIIQPRGSGATCCKSS